jgi:succinate dehydrogenase flavin-adding protein (antitoxin of CptAB toxin-antitoxin module)
VAVDEVGVARIDVAGLHRNQVSDQLVGGLHGLLEELDDDLVEFLLKLRVPPKELLSVNAEAC